MDAKSNIEFHIEGYFGKEKLSPENFDTTQLIELLNVVNKLFSEDRNPQETPISYYPKAGSLIAVFRGATETVAKFATVMSLLSANTIDSLTDKSAASFEELQDFSIKHGYDIDISTTYNNERLKITPHTNFYRSTNMYAEAELYLFGKIIMGGGKSKGTIKLETDNGIFTIDVDKEVIGGERNYLYKEYGVRVTAKQNVLTGDIKKDSVKLIEILDYDRNKEEAYLQAKIKKATPHWAGTDVDAYLDEIREGLYV